MAHYLHTGDYSQVFSDSGNAQLVTKGQFIIPKPVYATFITVIM